ncbi:DUF6602 domain-containing protein [Azotobacter beijerinckii]|uniref:DUF6602 domain-containing protein n=1 Tax=Azotobacter beijerinckii TaxID=170623 RepID=A0A1I0Y683_9GAMM|nr:DUF6602 domain-containing protein [Azotobacter beijerinckii]SFB07653.1 hypothetical protein SAMN04244571_01341 [Azotobacter beijerinckii]
MSIPDIAALNRIEEQLLRARLDSVRSAIAHAGEKGRDLEFHVRRLLRDLLPAEYGLTTGFVAHEQNGTVTLSNQLDLIIYDSVRYSPLVHLESCDVLPLEAVYGYVEVKAAIRSSSRQAKQPAGDTLDGIVKQNALMRKLRNRAFLTIDGSSPIKIKKMVKHWLAPRAYVVAFEASGRTNPDKFANCLACALERQGNGNAHIHGILIPNYGFFYTRPVDERNANADDYFHVKYTTDHPLLAFKSILLKGLASFPRAPESWSPDIGRYLQHNGQWQERSPQGVPEA